MPVYQPEKTQQQATNGSYQAIFYSWNKKRCQKKSDLGKSKLFLIFVYFQELKKNIYFKNVIFFITKQRYC